MAESERAKLDNVLWSAIWGPYRDSAHSLQTQVRHMLIAAMLDGVLPSGTYLPSTRDLAQELDVSRNTVVIVYQQLVDDGYLRALPRVGYWVAEVLPERKARIETNAVAGSTRGETQITGREPDWERRMRQPPPNERNIEKPSNWRDFSYPFLYGQFDGRMFPLADWRLCCLRTLNLLESYEWGQDMFLPDDQTLAQQIRTRLLTRRGIQAREDEIIVTIGSQQGLHLLADLLMTDGVHVGVEDPGYPDARNIFRWRGAVLTGLPVDQHGLKIGPGLCEQSYVYVTPSHQCPTMVTMTLARRYALLKVATKHDLVVLEDDYETEDGWSGPATPALKSLDTEGRVIYLGSLSKSLAPGLRIGYIVGPRKLVKALHRLRRLNVRHPSTFGQRALALFIGLGYYNAMLRKLAAAHAERALVLMEAMRNYLPDWQVNSADGGSALWVRGPDGLDARSLATMAERRGVLIEPGDVFFLEPDGASRTDAARYLRMGFTSIDARRIDQGVQSLRDAFRDWRDTVPANRSVA